MIDAMSRSGHTFHIPVMGTGYTIDTPLRVAKYGISSVISLVDDVLIEQMREFHCRRMGEEFEPIERGEEDVRARRITAWLNFIDRHVQRQVEELRRSPFEPGSEITRYFELLPDCSQRQAYEEMLATAPGEQRDWMQAQLRKAVVAGSIDANIMSKSDWNTSGIGGYEDPMVTDAAEALRGFAKSTVDGSMVFSAGMNPRLYGYVGHFDDFFPDKEGWLRKKVTLKVSDYRSAVIQGKFLAKRGIWVSEFRIESGLNCGGHAFGTKGILLGPILEEFKKSREDLQKQLHALHKKACARLGKTPTENPPEMRLTVQGGIGTAAENQFLMERYGVDGTGWATPFLLVPEVSNVDDEHLEKLSQATADDVYLSNSSPFGLPFWNLRNSASENARRQRIADGRPGHDCKKGYCKLFNTEFTKFAICVGSRQYQAKKLAELDAADMSDELRAVLREEVLAKSCICHDLAGGATRKNNIDPNAVPAVCCGPGIADFSKIATLEEMVDHIYGRKQLPMTPGREHMFARELRIYMESLREELKRFELGLSIRPPEYFDEYLDNLSDAIDYYRELAAEFQQEDVRKRLAEELEELKAEVARTSPGRIPVLPDPVEQSVEG
ncbi:MAG: hypothetical protein JXM70_21945 [Pirellulales bacterium]|nr:hypothetical protein [Pirellulales bacterium]